MRDAFDAVRDLRALLDDPGVRHLQPPNWRTRVIQSLDELNFQISEVHQDLDNERDFRAADERRHERELARRTPDPTTHEETRHA